MTIISNIAARDAHTAALRGDRTVTNIDTPPVTRKRAMSATEATEALFGWIYKQPGMATAEDCQRALAQIHEERGARDAKELLQRFGSKSIKELPLVLYHRFFERATICLQFGVAPGFGFVDKSDIESLNVPRDRWLLWHPESECLFEHRGKIGNMFGNEPALCDVSGIQEYEQRFVREKEQ